MVTKELIDNIKRSRLSKEELILMDIFNHMVIQHKANGYYYYYNGTLLIEYNNKNNTLYYDVDMVFEDFDYYDMFSKVEKITDVMLDNMMVRLSDELLGLKNIKIKHIF